MPRRIVDHFRARAASRKRVFRIFVVLLAGYAVLALPAWIWPAYADSRAGLLLLAPLLSLYLFHALGVPGLLEHGGLCGWGWCAPSPFGWVFLAASWLGLAWGIAWLIAKFPWPRHAPVGVPRRPSGED